MKNIAVIIFEDFEEIEAITPVDLLRRAGAHVEVLTLENNLLTKGRSSIFLHADFRLQERFDFSYDMIVLSGGSGVHKAINNNSLIEFLKNAHQKNLPIGAICAAPIILKKAGILENKNCTGHPSVADQLELHNPNISTILDKNIITSKGAGTAIDFSLMLIEFLYGLQKSNEVSASICYKENQ